MYLVYPTSYRGIRLYSMRGYSSLQEIIDESFRGYVRNETFQSVRGNREYTPYREYLRNAGKDARLHGDIGGKNIAEVSQHEQPKKINRRKLMFIIRKEHLDRLEAVEQELRRQYQRELFDEGARA